MQSRVHWMTCFIICGSLHKHQLSTFMTFNTDSTAFALRSIMCFTLSSPLLLVLLHSNPQCWKACLFIHVCVSTTPCRKIWTAICNCLGIFSILAIINDKLIIIEMQITRSDTRPQVKWPVSLVIVDGHFNLPQEFVWVCMSYRTHFIIPKQSTDRLILCLVSDLLICYSRYE